MSVIKARWRTYNTLQVLLSRIPHDFKLFDIEDFRPKLNEIVREWSLDVDKLAKISGVPNFVVEAIIGTSDRRYNAAISRNPNGNLSLAPDTRKLINGLLAWIGPSEADISQLAEDGGDTKRALERLGPQARDFLEAASAGVVSLEVALCNIAKTNQLEPVAAIAFSLARLRDLAPVEGFSGGLTSEGLLREIAELKARVSALSEERDRLYKLIEKNNENTHVHLKTGFLQQVGALPVAAAVGVVGLLCGSQQAQAMMSYIEAIVTNALGMNG